MTTTDKSIREYPLQWMILGAMFANKSVFEKIHPLADGVFDPDCMGLIRAMVAKDEVQKKRWLESHSCPVRPSLVESLVAWAEVTSDEHKRTRLLRQLASKTIPELEAMLSEKEAPTKRPG